MFSQHSFLLSSDDNINNINNINLLVASEILLLIVKCVIQVKGLSIEHEKLAVAKSRADSNMDTTTALDSPTARKHLKLIKEEMDPQPSSLPPQSSPSHSSFSPAMSPYMYPHHYRQYEQRLPSTGAAFEPLHKRPLRSPNELLQESVRASVLRDGSKAGRPTSPGPMSLAYRPSSSSSCSLPPQPEADAPPENRFDPDPAATALICPESNTANHCQDPGCPEGIYALFLYIKWIFVIILNILCNNNLYYFYILTINVIVFLSVFIINLIFNVIINVIFNVIINFIINLIINFIIMI